MSSEKYSSISFCPDSYKTYNEFSDEKEVDEIAMWSDIGEFLRIAVKNGQQVKLWYDGYTVCAEYNYQDESLSGVSLEWLDEDEYIEKYGESNDDDEGE